jgi:uncharacterized protein DUF5658
MRYLLTRWLSGLLIVLAAAVSASAQERDVIARTKRPAVLMPLYVTFVGLQALDVHSTMSAVGSGAREANPMMRSAVGNPAGMVVLKAGTAVGVVFLTEKVWRHNRTAAIVTMFALNSAYITVAAHNYQTAARR